MIRRPPRSTLFPTRRSSDLPRIGATDVLPFVPVRGVTMDECVALAHEAGRRIWQELSIPVYFYERAGLRPDRIRLEKVRGKGIEQLRREIETNPDRAPDVGEKRTHPTAGAIAVGARPFLIAFNVNLRTNDIAVARSIARAIRESGRGMRRKLATEKCQMGNDRCSGRYRSRF